VIERLAWVTAKEARGRDDDEPIALAALRQGGLEVDVVDWDDPDVTWSGYDRAVLRSTWDYPQRLDEFLAWLDSVADVTDVVNPVPVVRWNLDKHYLADLDAAGVPVIPTTFVERGDTASFPDGGFVVKPAVGAGSRDVASYGPDEHETATAHVARLQARGESVLIQPLVDSVAADGEWPLVFLGGEYSHAASKRVVLPRAGVVDDLFVEEANSAHTATPAQIETARAAMDAVVARFGVPAYARVDLVRAGPDDHRVLEVELVEPSLFLPQAEPAAALRLAEALRR
jgi:glutathione synthase/RimK-type ligase-like ATP-grasp enzyme